MRKTIAALVAVAGLAAAASADDLAIWTFETSLPTTAGPHAAEGGLNAGVISGATGFHAGGSTYSNPVGNGSAESFSSNTWAVDDYYQFSTSTVGYESIAIQWDQASSGTGPRDFQLYWSTDGLAFSLVDATTYMVLANAAEGDRSFWSSGTHQPVYSFGPVGGPSDLDDEALVYFRVVNSSTVSANGGTVASGGTNRVDNVIISGTLIPAPGSIALLGLGGLVATRRRR